MRPFCLATPETKTRKAPEIRRLSFSPSLKLQANSLAATGFVAATVTVTIDAVAAAFDRLADERASETTGNRADCSAAPAVADSTTDDSAATCADRRALLCGGARCQRADQGTNKYNLLHHDISPRFFGRLDPAHEYKNDNNDEH
jgi:hypothetical protein